MRTLATPAAAARAAAIAVISPVKTTRRYDSPRRREQAAATRSEILRASQRLFEQEGYGATTMAAIAAEAGVSLKTMVPRHRDRAAAGAGGVLGARHSVAGNCSSTHSGPSTGRR